MKKLVIISVFLLILGCDKNEADSSNAQINGTGAFLYDVNQSNLSTSINVFYHIPDADVANMPILFALHGAGRDAVELRDAWIAESNIKEFILIVPEFTEQFFPGGNAYILGNVFEDGNNPSPQTLNPELDWTFSLIEPIFEKVKSDSGNKSTEFNMYGFSAGAQFVHRFIMFKPNASFDKVVASAAGWYTTVDQTTDFPYGLNNSPLEEISKSSLLDTKLIIQIGTLDNNPNAPNLRRNPIVDQQGNNRLARAYFMYNTTKDLAESLNHNFNWEIVETANNDHNIELSIQQASNLLF